MASNHPQQSTKATASARAARRARLAKLDSEIKALELVLSKDKKRTRAKYPVLTLPNEIVSEIFTHVLPEYPHRPPAAGLSSPTLLSHICRQWREIALSTPTLWRAISISLRNQNTHSMPTRTNQSLASQLCLLETWLARSRSCPLSIMITSIWDVDQSVAPFVRAIVPHCNRWEHLWLLMSQNIVVSLIKGPMPLLRVLRIGLTAKSGSPAVSKPVVVFQDAPQLRTIILMTLIPPNIILPWAQFTRFITRNVSQNRCSEVLERMPNLVYCKLQLFGTNSILRHQRLAHLETLIVEDTSPPKHNLTGFVASLTLPALRKLHIPERFLLPDPVDTFAVFVSRSGCNLEEVRIIGPKAKANEYRRAVPSIPRLEVKPYYTGDEVDSEPDSDEYSDDADSGSEVDGDQVAD